MSKLSQLSVKEFNAIAKKEIPLNIDDYEAFFQKQIAEAANYATGPYFWFVGDNYDMQIKAASLNVNELTPYDHQKWTTGSALFFAENLHPEDCFYVLSALSLAVKKIEELPVGRQSNIRVNIYARMLNASSKYRWVLIQMPRLHIDNLTKTNCALMLVTDLSHLSFSENPILMTLTDKVANKNVYYKIDDEFKKMVDLDSAVITKREREVLAMMIMGHNSPQIAEKLFISYNTVENHKRNLRLKTNSKTSAELIYYVLKNNLL